jgi:acetyl-CoA carboxylase carboxyltransferase component
MSKTVNELKTIVKQITLGGSEEARTRHTSKNKLLVRDRVDKLLDPKFVFFCKIKISFSIHIFIVLHFSNFHN